MDYFLFNWLGGDYYQSFSYSWFYLKVFNQEDFFKTKLFRFQKVDQSSE